MFQILKDISKNTSRSELMFWGILLSVVLGIEIIATVLIPVWRGYFFDGVEAKNYAIFINGLWLFVALMGMFTLVQGVKYYLAQRLAFIWRKGITKTLKTKWDSLIKVKYDYNNPDQRISEDAKYMSESAIEVTIEVVISASIIIGLISQMWGDWMLLGLSLLYTVLATGVAMLFHRPLVNREKNWESAEADFRFSLAQIRHKGEKKCTKNLFNQIQVVYYDRIKMLMGFTLVSKAKSYLMNLVPYLILIPMYFASEITFGEVMKGISQFDLLVINATILIIMYPKVVKALAAYERVKEFYEGLDNE